MLSRHGDHVPVELEALTADDPDLWLVNADMHAWSEAHRCECQAMCLCDDPSPNQEKDLSPE